MAALAERALERFHTLRKSLHDRYVELPRAGKVAVWVYFGVHIGVMLAVWIITPGRLMDCERRRIREIGSRSFC